VSNCATVGMCTLTPQVAIVAKVAEIWDGPNMNVFGLCLHGEGYRGEPMLPALEYASLQLKL
jgi:hypothetical protein